MSSRLCMQQPPAKLFNLSRATHGGRQSTAASCPDIQLFWHQLQKKPPRGRHKLQGRAAASLSACATCHESPLGAALGLNLGAMTICCSPLHGSQRHITTSRLHSGADFKCCRRQSCKPKRLINRAPQRRQNNKHTPFANSFCLARAHHIEISIAKHRAATTRTASTASPQCTRQLTPFSGLRSHLLCRTRELHCIAHRWSCTRNIQSKPD